MRFFKSPAPVREISLVTRRAFVKQRLVGVLKAAIIDNLPENILKNKPKQVVPIMK